MFVTSAYKKKLEEIRLEEEKEKREEYLENIGDVTKQRDLGISFAYRRKTWQHHRLALVHSR